MLYGYIKTSLTLHSSPFTLQSLHSLLPLNLCPRIFRGIGFQPVISCQGFDKLEAYPTVSNHSLSFALRIVPSRPARAALIDPRKTPEPMMHTWVTKYSIA